MSANRGSPDTKFSKTMPVSVVQHITRSLYMDKTRDMKDRLSAALTTKIVTPLPKLKDFSDYYSKIAENEQLAFVTATFRNEQDDVVGMLNTCHDPPDNLQWGKLPKDGTTTNTVEMTIIDNNVWTEVKSAEFDV